MMKTYEFTAAARKLFDDGKKVIFSLSPRSPQAGEYGMRIRVPITLKKVRGRMEEAFIIDGSDLHAGCNNLGEVGLHADKFEISDVNGNAVTAQILRLWHRPQGS